jgi:transcriptional regulator with XRE-family HTH domain
LRAQKGLTQRELAAKVGIAFSMISKYESGKSEPRLKILMRLADALSVSTQELQGENSGRPPVELYDGFSARLLEMRQSKKISLRLLAKRTGIDTSTLTQFELGEVSPSTDDVYQLAEALGANVTDLAGEKDEQDTVRIRMVFEDAPDDPVVFAATAAQYQSLIDTASRLGMTPEDLFERFIRATAEAARDPENASEAALDLLKAMKSE